MAELADTRTEQDASFRTPTTSAEAGSAAAAGGDDASARTDRGADPATPLPNPPGLIKERRIKEDGRYIIFYWEEGAGLHV